jgi:uncharacterized protein with von Willebrand factor type A (vWA) domain
MASRGKKRKPARIYIPVVPDETSWLECDSYDRRAWKEIQSGAPTIAELVETGENLVPYFGSLLQDIFLGLFKYNLVWNGTDHVRRGATLNRTILQELFTSKPFEALKMRTLLEEDKAAIAALALAEEVLEMVRGERLINRREMLDLWDLKHQEEDLKERADALKALTDQPPNQDQEAGEQGAEAGEQGAAEQEMARKMEELKEAANRAAQVSEARLNHKAREMEQTLKQARQSELKRLQLKGAQLAQQIDEIAEDAHDFSLEFGQAGRLSAGERLELGRKLARNRKIAELARMVGRFKQDALALRRKNLDRGSSELYDIERGAELARLIPAELVALHHPILFRDFKRRLLDNEILQYQLNRDEEKGKGPMVVCLDLSSSMQGEKELWGKAVTLTLMDLARRQRRLFRAVLFSSGEGSLKVLDMNNQRRYEPELSKVLELAEYFPGGGTEFERPIDAAVELLGNKKLQRGDIVIITDGECQVSPEWLAQLNQRKDELQFKIFAVLVDLGSSETSTLTQFSDRLTSVKQLSAKDTRQIFLNI